MDNLPRILVLATSKISSNYFLLPIDGGDPVYRERVYCYELYHQLRCEWDEECKYSLMGEVDKSAHPILKNFGADGFKPDFLIHSPGHMAGNNTIIEVKSEELRGIEGDLNKLSLFVRDVGYMKAIYLFFGYNLDNKKFRIIKEAASKIENLAPIEVWFHQSDGHPAELQETIGSRTPDG